MKVWIFPNERCPYGSPDRKNKEKARTIECIEQAYERKNARDYHDRVLNYYIQALVMYQRVLPMNDDNITECLERIGHFYDVIGKFDLGLDTSKKSLGHVNALIVVDVQNCFITGNLSLSNSPAHQNGVEVVPVINHLIQTIPFHVIVYTYDWHPWNHISFFENLETRRKYLKGDQNRTIQMLDEVTYTGPKYETNQVLWPSHCVGGTDDAALHKKLYIASANNSVIHIRKGTDPDIDSYSAFADNNRVGKTILDEELRERNVTQVFVAGLATDYCVAATALDAFDLNYTTYLIEDASRGVDLETIRSKLADLKQRGIEIIRANQVKALIDSASDKSFNFLLIVSINVLFLL